MVMSCHILYVVSMGIEVMLPKCNYSYCIVRFPTICYKLDNVSQFT
jgi:hypothetical protein